MGFTDFRLRPCWEQVPEPQVSEGEGAYTREQALDDLRGIKGKEATTLLETVARGVAFHNSDLTADLRKVVQAQPTVAKQPILSRDEAVMVCVSCVVLVSGLPGGGNCV